MFIVQLNKTTRNILFEEYFNFVGMFDMAYVILIQILYKAIRLAIIVLCKGYFKQQGLRITLKILYFFIKIKL